MLERGMFDLSGKIAIVTGGGSGIGRSLCEAIAEFGADVAICDINEEWARETAKLISKFGHRTLVIKADVSIPHEVEHMVSEIVAKFGAIDILFNNAGIYPQESKIHETTIEAWDKIMAVNLRGVFLCMRAVLPVMIKQKKGSIINITSINGIMTKDREIIPSAHYNASKAGVIALTRQAATEYASDGIRVNCIAPGQISGTNIVVDRQKRWSQEKLYRLNEMRLSRIPLRRNGKPEDLKGISIYLASDASSFATGQTFIIDGGELA